MEHKQSNYITAKLGPHLVAHAEHGGGGQWWRIKGCLRELRKGKGCSISSQPKRAAGVRISRCCQSIVPSDQGSEFFVFVF